MIAPITKIDKNIIGQGQMGPITEILRETYIKISKNNSGSINEESFRSNLLPPEMPDPDLLIRTAGEKRVSNFLLYQLSYTELMFVDTLWPDFDENQLDLAVKEFENRVRKYGNA